MNQLEKNMVDILRKGKEKYGVVSVKAEFEAEGTRIDELLRLVDVARKAELDVTLKIGGCEAIRDLLETKQIGVQYIVAPMVETPYAASKFIAAKNLVFAEESRKDMKFLINIETLTAHNNFDEILKISNSPQGLDGFVFGRVDFVGSQGLERKSVDSEDTLTKILEIANKVKLTSNDLVVGGGVSPASLSLLKKVKEVHLSRFETRKVVFSSQSLDLQSLEEGLLDAVHFELLWLLNKKEYYGEIMNEDNKRISMLEERWQVLGRTV